jgi:hypothetical protein
MILRELPREKVMMICSKSIKLWHLLVNLDKKRGFPKPVLLNKDSQDLILLRNQTLKTILKRIRMMLRMMAQQHMKKLYLKFQLRLTVTSECPKKRLMRYTSSW